MKFFWTLLIVAFLFASCNTTKTNTVASDYIPENTQVVFKINNSETLNTNLTNSDFLNKFSNSKAYKNFKEKLTILDSLHLKNDALLCFIKDNSDSLQYKIIANTSSDSLKTDSTKLKAFKNYKHENDFLIIASQKDLLERAQTNNSLNQSLQTNTNNLSFTLKNDNPILKSFFLNDTLSTIKFSSSTLLEAQISQDALLLSGITKATDSTESLINIFKHTIPQENEMSKITPSNADGFMSFTFDNFSILESNLKKFRKRDSITETNLFDFISEVGVIYQDSKRAIVLKSIDDNATQETLSIEQNVIETYRQISINSFSQPELFNSAFSPLITYNLATKYCLIDNYIVFSDDIEMLQNIIVNYQNKTTIADRKYFSDLKTSLTDEASLMMLTNTEKLVSNFGSNFKESLNFSSTKYNKSAIQFTYEDNFAHVNIAIKKQKNRVVENSITEQFNIKLDSDLLNDPQFVTNHITKQKDIVVQDINNQLYLISNSGKILWKKQLQGAVLGDISQIDMYKNGRLQLAFTTPNRLYVLDRNGNDVTPFPLKFNDAITQPLAVFDYDKKRNYRLIVTQGQSVLMYDAKGKSVNGFTFKKADNEIVCKPQHFRIGNKDYLVFKTKSKLHILNRTGKTRVTPKNSYNYSNQDVYIYNNKFTTTSENGALVTIDQSGNTASENINLSEEHYLTTTSKSLVTLSENKLRIRNNTIELDFGNYTAPEIFLINNKLYISVTDLQTQKVLVFDSQAKLQNNFPIYATSQIDFTNADKDKALEFVTKGESDTIILYQIN